jgi:four helix bundle protein
MATNNFKDLDVWKRSMDFVVLVYELTKQLPAEEKYAISDQLKRAVVSIPSNIAEGQKRAGIQETIQFSYIALGSTAEVETQLIIVNRIYKVDVEELLEECEIIGRMLTSLTKSLKAIK